MQTETFYQQLQAILEQEASSEEARDMVAFIRENAQEYDESEEQYLASLGTPQEVALILQGKYPDSSAAADTLPPIPEDARTEAEAEMQDDFSDTVQTESDSDSQTDQNARESEAVFLGFAHELAWMNRLSVDLPLGGVRIQTGDECGIWASRFDSDLSIQQRSGHLKISKEYDGFPISLFRPRQEPLFLTIVIPSGRRLEKVSLSCVNAKSELYSVQAQKLKFSSVGGGLFLGGCGFETANLSTVTGSLQAVSCSFGKFKSDGVSTNLTLQECDLQSGTINPVNGAILLENCRFNGLSIETVTGRIHVPDTLAPFVRNETPGQKLKWNTGFSGQVLKIESVNAHVTIRDL